MRSVLILLGLLLLVPSCASTMMVFTAPGNAEILVDGQVIGRSPVLYAGASSLDGAVEVTARLPGYQETTVRVFREPDISHLGEALIFPVFFPWGWYLPDALYIRLELVHE
ncbi:MAG: PEGA domain-containing protein [Candidatus Methylomirabilales bacterium]